MAHWIILYYFLNGGGVEMLSFSFNPFFEGCPSPGTSVKRKKEMIVSVFPQGLSPPSLPLYTPGITPSV